MQKEIQALVVALQDEQKKETELLQSILVAMAVGGAARKDMIRDIAHAVARTEGVQVEARAQPAQWYEGDVATAISSIRKRVA